LTPAVIEPTECSSRVGSPEFRVQNMAYNETQIERIIMKKIAMIAWNIVVMLAILNVAIRGLLAAYQLFWDVVAYFQNRKDKSKGESH
jgi:hypothetical protein